MRYFKRKWAERRGDEFDNWGIAHYYFETDNNGQPIRQIENYENGVVLKYDNAKPIDDYGQLSSHSLDLIEFSDFEIHSDEFNSEWIKINKSFIYSRIIGLLWQNDRFNNWWESSLFNIPFFDNKDLKIIFMDFVPENDDLFIREADEALELFLNKSNADRLQLSKLVFKNCKDFLNAVGFDENDKNLWEIQNEVSIWNFVSPNEIYVSRRPYKDKNIYIDINCECEWEQEHGLQLVFRQGKKITRVSQIDGHVTDADAYGKPDSEDELLSKFENDDKSQLKTPDEESGKKNANLNIFVLIKRFFGR